MMLSFEVDAVQRTIPLKLVVVLGLVLGVGLSNGYSQVLYGSIVGTVTDPSGAVVPGATDAATDVGTGQTRTDTSDQNGRFILGKLLPDKHSLSVMAKGFRKLEQSSVQVTPNTVN